ncbi:MAG: hypothetical protein HY242_01885 [Afipia sp.]|nr:hypothetical protein [Afipia sp.]
MHHDAKSASLFQRPLPDFAINLAQQVFVHAGAPDFVASCRTEVKNARLSKKFDWDRPERIFEALLTIFNFQGVSDSAARSYLAKHGLISWDSAASAVRKPNLCPKLKSFWRFADCHFDKTHFTCAKPEKISTCPLPAHPFRNGKLNQNAYSLFLFMRDVARNDLAGWIDRRIQECRPKGSFSESDANWSHKALIEPLRGVFGVSDKVLTMSLSGLLIGRRDHKPHWFAAGANLVAIDTLVHNFFHRTGITEACGRPHAYGPICYAPGGCAEIVRRLSATIDARVLNPSFPGNFPRLVQHALWRYCAADGLNVCNGNQIRDHFGCQNRFCRLFNVCKRKPLKVA